MSIKIGDKCPIFSLLDQKGEMYNLSDVIGLKNCVIYFYPKDNTWGCTKQACSFRDAFQDFVDLGSEVIGISSDSVNSHELFSKKYNLNFPILSDSKDKVRNLFGVPKSLFGLLKGRVTYIVDKNGIVVWVFNSQVNSVAHISKAINFVKNMEK
jgi:peroxiredoxin Q/BCP